MEELAEELEEQRELATNTLQELEQLNIKYRENLKKVEELQMNVRKTRKNNHFSLTFTKFD